MVLSKLIKIVEDYKKKDVKNDKRMHLNQKDNNNHFCCIIPGHACVVSPRAEGAGPVITAPTHNVVRRGLGARYARKL